MSAQDFAQLQRLGVPTVTTAQAAAAWRQSSSGASRILRELANAGLIEHLRHGVWLLDRTATAESLGSEVTAPYPSYVSHVSALYNHGVIDQVPAEVHLVSAAEPRSVETSRGRYRLHRMPTALFGGYTNVRGANVATSEKALFDWAYLSVASGSANARLPETEWPSTFRHAEIDRWVRRITSRRLRTMAKSLLDRRIPDLG